MKRCPYCDEEVRENAIKCKHCGSRLSGTDTDTLDRAVTLEGTSGQPQYDTLDVAATTGGEAAILAGQYRIIEKIGEGGMGVVYLAEDTEMRNRPVAIKVLPPVLSRNKRAVENLRGEAITAIRLNHPNIVRLYGFHSDGDIRFLVMEYIDGVTLEEKIFNSPSKKLNLDKTIEVAEQVAKALDYAHSQSPPVIHRDLKSSNVMIDKNGSVKVLDFSIAREIHDSYTTITGKGDTSGTLPYMSPEQVRGQRPAPSMDIYSLGIICYECLNGKVPFYTGELTYQIIHEKPAFIEGVPDYTNDTIRKILAKDSGERPKTAEELVKLLTQTKPEPIAASRIISGSKAGDVITNSIGMKLSFIPAGEFMMGSPSSESQRESDESPQHRVKISKGFYMGIYEVTQAQYKAVMDGNPSYFKGDNLPVEEVSWNDATEFCKKLSRKEGKTYRLPTEAEWEYACRAGSQTRFCFGDSDSGLDEYAWCGYKKSGKQTHLVGQKKPNAFGLYDMHGNVWEWCQDWYDENYYSNSPGVDPEGPNTGTARVLRGGSWYGYPRRCRSAVRSRNGPGYRYVDLGFRVVVLDFQ